MELDEKKEDRVIIKEDVEGWMKKNKVSKVDFANNPGIKILTRKQNQAKVFIQYNPLFYDKSGLWWIWDREGKYYKLVDEIDLLNLFGDDSGEDIINSKNKTEIINALKQEGRKNVPPFSDKKLLQFKDGLVHIDHPDSILEPNPSYFITNTIPWKLGESEDTPTIDHLFEQWVGKAYTQTLYEILAYCMLGEYPIQRIFCFVGSGLNGKGTYLRLMNKFLGEHNVTSTELDSLLVSRFEVTRLYKKLVCQMGETNFTEISKTSMLKKLTGGDLIGFEYKGKNPFEDYNYAKILVSTNGLPTTNDKTDGFYRRWLIIDFPHRFTELSDVLGGVPDIEFENLGRKCVRILKSLLERRQFTNEGTIEERKMRYEERSNPFDKFWEMFVGEDFSEESYIVKGDFKRKLNSWLIENRHRAMSDVSISSKMEVKGVETKRVMLKEPIKLDDRTIDRAMAWSGIVWKDPVKGGRLVNPFPTQSLI